jgi:hypothetical protein
LFVPSIAAQAGRRDPCAGTANEYGESFVQRTGRTKVAVFFEVRENTRLKAGLARARTGVEGSFVGWYGLTGQTATPMSRCDAFFVDVVFLFTFDSISSTWEGQTAETAWILDTFGFL